MQPLIIIPARGGSKGVPGKNIKKLNGIPLVCYTVAAARAVFDDEQIIVSTDDSLIKKCVEETGLSVPFLRPSVLATDTASTHEVLLHAIEYSNTIGYFPDTVILLQPTSPFRNETHIKDAIKEYRKDLIKELDMLVSVKETESNPYYVLFEEDKNEYLQKSKKANFTRRQDCPKVWEYNGAIYIVNIESLKKGIFPIFKKTKKFVMDDVSSLDIDTELDWKLAEFILEKSV